MLKKDKSNLINQNTFQKIDKYLSRRGHKKILSIFLENFNQSNIYIRFDYVKKISAYRVTWIDLNFLDIKHISDYVNIQTVNKNIAISILKLISKIDYENEKRDNEDIIGDKIHVEIEKTNKTNLKYMFTRFLPEDWDKLIDPFALIFSYLPRAMDIFLNEIFAIFDGTEEIFTYTKPIKFDLEKTNPNKHFKSINVDLGTRIYDSGRVIFLEEIEDKYYAIVEDREPHLVVLNQIDKEHSMMWCNCKNGYLCPHIYASLLAIRHKKINNFYKVHYKGNDETLLEKVMFGNFYLCYGVNNDKILLVSLNGESFAADIIQKGKCVFDVIEDDDNCSLSKILQNYKK